MIEVRADRSVCDIEPSAWRGLRIRHVFESRGWLAANEPTSAGEPVVTSAWEDGELRSVLVWQATAASDPSPYYNVNALVARWQGGSVGGDDGWALSCTAVGARSPILLAPGAQLDADLLDRHIRAAAGLRSAPPRMVGVNFLPRPPLPGTVEALRELGFAELRGFSRAKLALSGKTYDDYLDALGSRKRWNARRDRRRFAESGQRVSFATGPGAMGEDVVALQGRNKAKYGQAFDPVETRRRYRDLLGFAQDDGLVVRTWSGDTCTGFALFVRAGRSLHALSAGFGSTQDDVGPYFECVFHAPIEWAYAHGIDEIDYGIGSVSAKSGRGCTVTDEVTWFRPEPLSGRRKDAR
ncbi:GNAT family N-acetyltransferase [Pimelobacter simplex]|uniref:GNAT family N-acetyltransferase n=1 Tax=Nocardioides simplex TaxID=2045 RepID=UPI00366FB143